MSSLYGNDRRIDNSLQKPCRERNLNDLKRKKRLDKKLSTARRVMWRRLKGKPSSEPQAPSLTKAVLNVLLLTFKVICVVLLCAGFTLFGLGMGMLKGYFSTAQEFEIADLSNIKHESKILDKNGNVVTSLSGASILSEFVSIDELKEGFMDDAVISIEDERFETHPGIDLKRIASAIIGVVANRGNASHGGSTITQQTVKLITGKDDISAQRKIQEWYNAVRLEKMRSKDAIMELYLNLMPMSNNIIGVQAAAKAYFNKQAKDLTLAECAFMAGIPNQPAICNPLTEYGRRNALRRSRFILAKMLELMRITPEEYADALNEELAFDFSFLQKDDDVINSYYIDYVIEQVQSDLVKNLGYSPELAYMSVYNYGLTIETPYDPVLQKKLEKVFSTKSLFVQDPSQIPDSPEQPQASICVMDNSPGNAGHILGMVGGYGPKKRNFILNRAVDAHRQPGSSIKPLLVYGPALETGKISMATPLNDRVVYFDQSRPDTPYPQNAYQKYLGSVTLKTALELSINTIAADIYLNYITPMTGLSFLKQCGIDRTDEPYVSGAMGGFKHGMSSLEMTAAFSVFANKGIYTKPVVYTKVLDHEGNILLDNSQNAKNVVYREETCSVVTRLLQYVAETPYNNLILPSTPAAGKTGTTENYTDVWFCGYTPYYTAAVWYGYDNANGRRTLIPEIDSKNAVLIWKATMESLHESLPRQEFQMAPGVISMQICPESGCIAGPFCPNPVTQYFIPGSPTNPSTQCPVHSAAPPKDDEDDIWPFGDLPNRRRNPNTPGTPGPNLPNHPNGVPDMPNIPNIPNVPDPPQAPPAQP